MSIVLGIDLGKNLGFALGDSNQGANGTVLTCGTIDLEKRATQLRCSRHTAAYCWARDYVIAHKIEHYCREDSTRILRQEASRRGAGGKNLALALEHHSNYVGAIESAVETRGVKLIQPVDPRVLKKFATGNGNAKKDQMLRAAQTVYGIRIPDDNAGDACHVCAYAMNELKVRSRKFEGVNW